MAPIVLIGSPGALAHPFGRAAFLPTYRFARPSPAAASSTRSPSSDAQCDPTLAGQRPRRSVRTADLRHPGTPVRSVSCRCTVQESASPRWRPRCGQPAGWAPAAASPTRVQRAARRRSNGRQAERNGLTVIVQLYAFPDARRDRRHWGFRGVVMRDEDSTRGACHTLTARYNAPGVHVYSAGPRITSIAAWPAISATK
jgi:hypothetical protein